MSIPVSIPMGTLCAVCFSRGWYTPHTPHGTECREAHATGVAPPGADVGARWDVGTRESVSTDPAEP